MASEVDYNYKGGNGWQFKGSTGFDWGYTLTSPGGAKVCIAGGDSDGGSALRSICREADQQAARIAELEAQVATLRELAQWAVDHGCSLYGGSSEAGRAYIAATEARND